MPACCPEAHPRQVAAHEFLDKLPRVDASRRILWLWKPITAPEEGLLWVMHPCRVGQPAGRPFSGCHAVLIEGLQCHSWSLNLLRQVLFSSCIVTVCKKEMSQVGNPFKCHLPLLASALMLLLRTSDLTSFICLGWSMAVRSSQCSTRVPTADRVPVRLAF